MKQHAQCIILFIIKIYTYTVKEGIEDVNSLSNFARWIFLSKFTQQTNITFTIQNKLFLHLKNLITPFLHVL